MRFLIKSALIGTILGGILAGSYVFAEIKIRERRVLPVSEKQEVISGMPASGQYTLVEFGDYQCNPCRMTAPALEEALDKHKGKVQFVFRHLPLSYHPLAKEAAIFAEQARSQGLFDKVHHEIYARGITSAADLDAIRKQYPMKLKSGSADAAKQKIEADVAAAKKLKIDGTPALFLCKPDGMTVRIFHPSQLDFLVK